MRVFISYSTRDGLMDAVTLGEVAGCLPESFNPFIDLFHNDSDDVQNRIRLEIVCCDLFLGLKSPAFFASPWVQFELQIARLCRKQIILLDVNSDAPTTSFSGNHLGHFACHAN